MSLKWIAFLLAFGLALVLAGSGALALLPAPQRPAAAPTPSPQTAAVSPTATRAPAAKSVSTPAPAPGVTSDEARQTVRAFFAALDANDFETARQLTAGSAREATDQIIARVESEAKARGVDLVIQTKRLDLAPPVAAGASKSVDADFSTEVNGKIGPLVVPGQTIAGRATFTVDHVEGQARIVRMSGLGM